MIDDAPRRRTTAIAVGVASFAVALAATPALAVDFTQSLTALDGKPLIGQDGKPTSMTLGQVAEDALTASYPDEQNISGAEKTKRYVIAQYIYETAFSSQVQNFGLAAAASVVLGVVLFVLTLLQFAAARRKEV